MRINGPYLRKDGRFYLSIVKDNGKKTTMSYPKYLMEQKMGRKLDSSETIDHIDKNPTNNNLDNLRIMTRSENSKEWNKNHPRPTEIITLICKYCGMTFQRPKRTEYRNRITLKRDGPFCSKKCVGKCYH